MTSNEPQTEPAPRRIKTCRPGQTVCDEPGEKDSLCSGHLKHYSIAPRDLVAEVPKGHILYRCTHCLQLYEGEPILQLR